MAYIPGDDLLNDVWALINTNLDEYSGYEVAALSAATDVLRLAAKGEDITGALTELDDCLAEWEG